MSAPFPSPTLDDNDLAKILKVSKKTLENKKSSDPNFGPPRIRIPGCKKPLYLYSDVLEWLQSYRDIAR